MNSHTIQPHNIKAAATWDAGGLNYDRISQSISDSIEHCIIRLAPRPGERILDVATGTGAGCHHASRKNRHTQLALPFKLYLAYSRA